MSVERETPKIACLPNGPYYLLVDMAPTAVPNLCRANGQACSTVRGVIREAVSFHVEGLREDGLPVPIGASQVEYIEVAA